MKKTFLGYYTTLKDSDDILNETVIVIDPDVLLCLYKLPQKTSEIILSILQNVKRQLWLPYIMAQDYHKKIDITITERLATLNQIIIKGKEYYTNLTQANIEIWGSDNERLLFENSLKKATKQIEKEMVNVRNNYRHDSELRNKIAELFKDRVGIKEDDPHPQGIPQVEEENMKRTDILNNSEAEEGTKEKKDYHAVIISTLAKVSTDKGKSVIYVLCNHYQWLYDVKENNRVYGINPEILSSFLDESENKQLKCYVLPKFLKILIKKYSLCIQDDVINEIKKYCYNRDQKY